MSPRTWRRLPLLLLLLLLLSLWAVCPLRADDLLDQLRAKQRAPAAASSATGPTSPQIELFYSPGGGCTAAVVKELNAAKVSVRV